MRFIHTADWHLGRLFHGLYLTEDQSHVLDQLIELARDEKVDAVIVAGDVYDRAVPPADAVRLLEDVLSRLILDVGIPVIMVAGNHDSPNRLDFGSRLLESRGLHIIGAVRAKCPCVTLHDEFGPVNIHPVPFWDPISVPPSADDAEDAEPPKTLESYLGSINASRDANVRSVLAAHAFAVGGKESESERPISIGGADRIDPRSFGAFNYTALGHLHRPQIVGDDRVRYSGSLLKYSFSEAAHRKSVALVDLHEDGSCETRDIALTPRRDVRIVEGRLEDIRKGPKPGESGEDYIMAVILDVDAILDVMGKVRQVYPNALHVERPHFALAGEKTPGERDYRRLSDLDLFKAFFRESTGNELSDEQSAAYVSIVEELRRSQREA